MEQRGRGGPGSWQDPAQDKPIRQGMINRIYTLLRQRKPSADEEWLKKLPDMARKLEDKLYRHASSMDEYKDESTLKARLQQVATEMRRDPQAAPTAHGGASNPSAGAPQPVTVSTQGVQPLPIHNQQPPSTARSVSASPSMTSTSPGTPMFSDYPQGTPQQGYNGGHHNSHSQQVQQHGGGIYQQAQQQPPQTMYAAAAQGPAPPSQHASMMPQSNYGSASSNPQGTPSQTQQGPSGRNGTVPSQRDVLRQQQQRLLLLRHASKCPAKPGECTATPHCAQMKQLWKHIAGCKDTECRVPHCVSSRFVLAHYHKCTDQQCDVCQPVRAAIAAKSSERQASAGQNGNMGPPPPGGGAPQPMMNGHGAPVPGGTQARAPPQQNPSVKSGKTMPPAPHQAGGAPNTSGMTNEQKLGELIQRYAQHWKVITVNADNAKKKQDAYEQARQEEKAKEREVMEAKEQERQLSARYAESGSSDALLEAQLNAIRFKCESIKAAMTAAQMQGKMLDAEVRAMKLQHERNLQQEKELHKEFSMLLGDPERVKKYLFQGRQLATQQMNAAAGMPQGQPPNGPGMVASGGRGIPQQQPAQTVAQLPAQAVVKGKAKKEPKEAKKPLKQTKKDKAAAESAIANASPGPGMPPMVGPYGMPTPPPSHLIQRQGSGIGGQLMIPPMVNGSVNVPPPPPSKSALQRGSSNPPTPKSAGARTMPLMSGAVPQHMPLLQPISMGPTQVFRDSPQVNRSVLETSLINTFVRRDIELHIQSLCRVSREGQNNKLRDVISTLLRRCQELDLHQFFEYPVDPVRDEAPNYFEIIKKPMDFQTIKKKMEDSEYSSLSQFADDVRLIYSNCMKYNPPGSIYYQTATACGKTFEKEYALLFEAEEQKSLQDRFDLNKCRLCGCAGFFFETVTYYCAGPCQQRIRRGTPMYSSSDNRHWCNNCFQNELPENIVLNDGTTINKRELRRGKLPEPVEEGWVNCYGCKRWFHQVCAMLNTKRGQDTKKDDFLCPFCVLNVLDAQKKDRIVLPNEPPPKKCCAKDLPETELSKFLEKAANARVVEVRKEFCAKLGMNLKDVEDVSPLTVRVVMAKEADVWTRQGMQRIYPKFPKAFSSRQKVILMFEKLDGVDTLIFIMFLQHYGSDCPAPNDRCLYIAYLDSVFYFRPSFIRTAVYHELITSVLEFEKRRGITRCFIWACPPTGGDDYIFHVHPKNQKTPKPDRLKIWYLTLLEDARMRGTVVSVTNLFDEYLSRMSDLIDVPYFEGDCWPTYAEHYITEMEQKGQDPRSRQPRSEAIRNGQHRKSGQANASEAGVKAGSMKRQNKRAKMASSGKGMKARSTSLLYENGADDEMDVLPEMPSGLLCPIPKQLEQVPLQSLITARIAAENDRMKEDFIVVKMYYDCVECATPMDYPGALYWLPKAYSPEKDPHDYRKRRYAPPYCLCNECYCAMYQNEYGTKPEFDEPAFPPPEWAEEYKSWLAARQSSAATANGSQDGSSLVIAPSSSTSPPPAVQREDGESASKKSPIPSSTTPDMMLNGGGEDSKGEAPPSTKRKSTGPGRKRKATGADVNDLDTIDSAIEVLEPGKNARIPNPYGAIPPIPLTEMYIQVAMIRPKTVDPDPLIECSIFNLREDFLSLCQGNKYQFDELRRAKHSSMMILYHLHNPESDAFVHTCNGCKMDITTARYTCSTCNDFDLCQNCNGKVKHAHPLEKVTSTSSSLGGEEESGTKGGEHGAGGQASGQVTHAQYLQMLEHSAKCDVPNCTFPNCARMKRLLEHAPSCGVRISGGCSTCKRYWQFLALHARQCRLPAGQCRVPHCEKIKGHIRAQANKVADRRMMALMQRTNQSPTPAKDDQQVAGPSGSQEAQPASAQPQQQPFPGGAAPPVQQRSLTSPRGKGGKGMRQVN